MFYQLFGLLFSRHPFTAEDPLVSKWCNDTFLRISFDEETNTSTSLMAWGGVNYKQIFIFGWTIPLSSDLYLMNELEVISATILNQGSWFDWCIWLVPLSFLWKLETHVST